jgi:hypothetical protein
MIILISLIVSSLASLLTFEVSKFERIGPIRASSGLTLLSFIDFSIINFFIPIDVNYWMAMFFGATFVGMSCPTKFSRRSILVSGALFAVIFSIISGYLQGLGGVLGLSAFLSIITIQLLRVLKKRILN